ncbi:hypothetical protein FISHEDRAFT_51837 [Fistulina hepatica ATCC 64428]|nr:hypothetical protein FISHEDRAFT_51837 [Fistulina hepatica ATCC 64428]
MPATRNPSRSPLVFNAALVVRAHTCLAYTAFLSALVLGCSLHYKKVVKNGVAGYPEEWFPSVSATIGDWYPERNIFQIFIALTAGPRLALVALQYYLHRKSTLSTLVFIVGLIRTLSCGGWVYITSTDDHDVHDVCMIGYMVCNIPWMVGTVLCTKDTSIRRQRFFVSIVPMIYFFIRHKVHRIPGGILPIFDFISDLYLSYIFWSVFTALIPTLFYFSIWELAIAGHEVALFCVLSPWFLSIPPLRSWALSHGGQTVLHLASIGGLTAYSFALPLHRLFVAAPAAVCAMLRMAAQWTGETDDKGVVYHAILTGLGLLVSGLSKHANHGNNPLWPLLDEQSGGHHIPGIIVALTCVAQYALRPRSAASRKKIIKEQTSSPHWLLAALPLGALIYAFHAFWSDPGTLIAWSWTGYESMAPRGPLNSRHGALTLGAQALGLSLPLFVPSRLTNFLPTRLLWLAFGCFSMYVMYSERNWYGYSGGLGVATFLGTLIPRVFENAAAASGAARVYGTAMLVYCLMTLANVWTVAYAFVPGGIYLRERTDLTLIAEMLCLTPAFFSRTSEKSRSGQVTRKLRILASSVLSMSVMAGLLVTLYRLPSAPPRPFKEGSRIVTAGIWTVHFGLDNRGRDSQWRIKTIANDMQLDILGLLETDLQRTVYGNRDLTLLMAEEMGYYIDTGPGPNSHTWGAVLLSKFPIINSTHHLLPSPHGELAPAIEAVLDIYGTEVTVIVSHNGQEEDKLDRELQSRELGRIMASAYPKPTIFLGYVVSHPHALKPAPYRFLVADGRMHDIDQDDADRWCQYILYRGVYRTAYARVSRGYVTDTELQIGRFVLPKYGEQVPEELDTVAQRYRREVEENMPEDHWFPPEYYGSQDSGGVNGHFYHVFDAPLYYQIPPGAVL